MPTRYFALIPAAGHSARMGQPKLLLPLAGKPLIGHTINAWLSSNVDRVVVVIRPGDDTLEITVREASRPLVPNSRSQVEIVIPESRPPDMKASLQAALAHLQRNAQPNTDDAFLVAPADMPRLSTAIIRRLMERHQQGDKRQILAPTIRQHRGHPVMFPWRFAAEVFQLGKDEGLNAVVDREAVELINCDDLTTNESSFTDIDTPEQYHQIMQDVSPTDKK
jgi:molybdenum cofactor cytidylyltransferase